MLGKVLNSENEARKTLASIKAAGYDGIELCGFMLHPMGFVIRMLTKAVGMPAGKGGKFDWNGIVKDSGLAVVSLHTDLGSLERDSGAVIKEAQSYNTKNLVITGMYRLDYSDENTVRELASRLNKAGKVLKDGGMSLLYHNHNCELLKMPDGRTAYDILIDDTNPELVGFEFDSYWFTEGGADALGVMKKLGKRMKLWHINDRGTRQKGACITPILKTDSMELGTGNMPLDALAEQARENGVEAVILESHRNWIDNSPVKSMELSAKWLNERF